MSITTGIWSPCVPGCFVTQQYHLQQLSAPSPLGIPQARALWSPVPDSPALLLLLCLWGRPVDLSRVVADDL